MIFDKKRHYIHYHVHSFQINPEIDLILTTITITDACNTLGAVFMITELGQRTTNVFSEIDDMICQWDWYSFPIELKRMLPTFLNVAQHPVEIPCFGSSTCSRETFKKVFY